MAKTLLIGFNEASEGREATLTVGRKIFGTDNVDLVNMLIGEEAEELWKKLTVPVKNEGGHAE